MSVRTTLNLVVIMMNWLLFTAVAACSILLFNPAYSEEKTPVKTERPVVVVETNEGSFEITLFPDIAPKTVENFLTHAQNHYYDGLTFHRVIPNFMIQGGDPKGNGTGGQSIWGKTFEDEFSKEVTFAKQGMLAMANRGPNTNGSQFFITTAATPWLNQKHTIFGEVTKGYDVVQKIENAPKGPQDRPTEPQKIISITLKAS